MAVPNYSIPPWLQHGADPAANYSVGLQIGARIGAEQAASQYQQQRLLAEQQRQAFEQQVEQTKLNLQVGELTRKHAAQQEFNRLLQSGMSPEQALMQAGPAMGESVNELLRTQAMMQHAKGNDQMRLLQLQASLGNMQLRQEREQRLSQTSEWNKAFKTQAQQLKTLKDEKDRNLKILRNIATDKVLNEAKSGLDDANRTIANLTALQNKSYAFWVNNANKEKLEQANKLKKSYEDQIAKRTAEITGQMQQPQPGTAGGGPESKRLRWTPQGLVPAQGAAPSAAAASAAPPTAAVSPGSVLQPNAVTNEAGQVEYGFQGDDSTEEQQDYDTTPLF